VEGLWGCGGENCFFFGNVGYYNLLLCSLRVCVEEDLWGA